MDMKVSGMYIARQLSFSGVTFRIEEIPLDPEYKLVYNRAAQMVRSCTCVLELGVDSSAGASLSGEAVAWEGRRPELPA